MLPLCEGSHLQQHLGSAAPADIPQSYQAFGEDVSVLGLTHRGWLAGEAEPTACGRSRRSCTSGRCGQPTFTDRDSGAASSPEEPEARREAEPDTAFRGWALPAPKDCPCDDFFRGQDAFAFQFAPGHEEPRKARIIACGGVQAHRGLLHASASVEAPASVELRPDPPPDPPLKLLRECLSGRAHSTNAITCESLSLHFSAPPRSAVRASPRPRGGGLR